MHFIYLNRNRFCHMVNQYAFNMYLFDKLAQDYLHDRIMQYRWTGNLLNEFFYSSIKRAHPSPGVRALRALVPFLVQVYISRQLFAFAAASTMSRVVLNSWIEFGYLPVLCMQPIYLQV